MTISPWATPDARFRQLVMLLGLVIASQAGSRAEAQRRPALGWVRLPGAEQCIGSQALAARVEQRLGRRIFVSASRSDLAVEGRIERGEPPNTWVATLAMSDRDGRMLGRRVLRSSAADCSALDDSLTLVIAVAIDPGNALPTTSSAPQALSTEVLKLIEQLGLPELDEDTLIAELALPTSPQNNDETGADTSKQGADEGSQPAPSPQMPKRDPGAAVAMAASVGGLLGPLPAGAMTLRLGLTAVFASFWPLELDVELVLPREARVREGTASFRMTSVGAGLCPLRTKPADIELWACLGARLGVFSAHGDGFAIEKQTTSPWAEVLGYIKATWHFGQMFVQIRAGLGAALIRSVFQFWNTEERLRPLHRPAAVTGHVGIGAGLRFP